MKTVKEIRDYLKNKYYPDARSKSWDFMILRNYYEARMYAITDADIEAVMYKSLKGRNPKLNEEEFYFYKSGWYRCAKAFKDGKI